MKVAVTSAGPSLESGVDARFGRCPYFVFVETDGMSVEAMENVNTSLTGGVGIQSAQLVVEKSAEAVLTGNCGPNAYQTLRAAGVTVYAGVGGTVREAVESLRRGELVPSPRANVSSQHGTGRERHAPLHLGEDKGDHQRQSP